MLGRRISASQLDSFLALARREPRPWIEFDAQAVLAGYNREPFLVAHRLQDHPLFTYESIAALCRRLPPNFVSYRVGKVADDSDFDASFGIRPAFTLDDALDRLEELQAYVYVNNPERDEQYRPIIEELVGEIASATEPLDPGMNWYSAYLFVSARDSVTPYHMDREMNFLLQIRGRKSVQLWDPGDPQVMSGEEKDELLAQAGDRRPPLRESIRSKGRLFELGPGMGVHHPFIAPHLVRTASALSISLAITFRTRGSDVLTRAHQLNHKLRSLGLRPSAVGRHPALDRTKSGALHLLRRVRTAWRGT